MSERTRKQSRRSCLTVPASSPKMLAKAPSLGADMVIIDLEDSVAADLKPSARLAAAAALRDGDWGDTAVFVRVNDWTSPWTTEDVSIVCSQAGQRLDGIVLPKADDPGMIRALDLILGQVERSAGLAVGHFGIEFQVETAAGLANVGSTCAASTRVEALMLGQVDFAASMQMATHHDATEDPAYDADLLHYAHLQILVAGRSHGLQVIDGPHVAIHDLDGLRQGCRRARALGFDGKWALHPAQVALINDAFTPTQAEFDAACRHVGALRDAAERGAGAAILDGAMVDAATGKLAEVVVRRGEAHGMLATPA